MRRTTQGINLVRTTSRKAPKIKALRLVRIILVTLAARESNKIGFVGQIFPITLVLFLVILIYDLRKVLRSRKNLLRQNCFAPHGELIFDRFWWDFAKQGINLASEIAPKDAKINHREAIRFDSLAAKVPQECLRHLYRVLPSASPFRCCRPRQ